MATKKEDDSKWLLWGVYPMFKLFQITGNVVQFEKWLAKEHGKKLDKQMLHGYKFFFETAFSQVLWSLDTNESLGIKHDFLLTSSTKESFFLGKLPNSCPKTIFLKNIYHHFNPITKSSNQKELASNLKHFRNEVILPFEYLFRKWFKPKRSKRLSAQQIEQFLLIEKVYLLFNHINNNGPYGYHGTLMKRYWIPEDKLEACFEGYKYAVQFTWWKILGERWYRKTVLKDLHTTTEWRGFVYNEQPGPDDEGDLAWIFNRTFDPAKQTSFDAFTYRIRDEFAWRLEEKYKISITSMEDWFTIRKMLVPHGHFKMLLLEKNAREEERTMKEELDMILYWYSAEIMHTEMHNAIATFVTLLRGSIHNLTVKDKEIMKALVCKFVHPREHPDGGNDYSYGVLIDTKAASGHYGSDWLIFYDCTGDYSGSAGAEYARTEKIIGQFVKQGKLEVREKKVNHDEFRKYISLYARESSRKLGKENIESQDELQQKLEESAEVKQLNILVSDAQGLLLELLSYHSVTKNPDFLRFNDIKWNYDVPAGQIDIILQNETEAHIVECKLSPRTLDLRFEIEKLRRKITETGKIGDFEFWFWNIPNETEKKIMIEERVKYFSFKEQGITLPASLKTIFNYSSVNL